MAFTNFYCNASAGANINAGDLTANGVVTSTNGAWSTVTNIFTAVGGTPFSGVTVGDFASVYIDGATTAVYIARVTTVGAGGLTLTLDTTAISGTAPTTSATGRSCTTGGAWKGPNAAENFPFGFVAAAMKNVAGDLVRVNLKNNATYNITAAITHNLTGYIRFEGYTTTAGDGGRAIIDGGTAGASYVLLTISAGNGGRHIKNLICQNNGASATAVGITIGSGNGDDILEGVVVNNVRGSGFSISNNNTQVVECEAYACNQSNTNGSAGFQTSIETCFVRCNAHDNAGNQNAGFYWSGGTGGSAIGCIADTNGLYGFRFADQLGGKTLIGCDAYNNGSDGVRIAGTGGFGYAMNISNCNFVKNGGYGINLTAGISVGSLFNCGFGAGTQANSSGQTNGITGVDTSTCVTYANDVTPWVDPANGDFRINLAAAKGAGRGTFTETAASYSGSIGYPDIGAAQHLELGSPKARCQQLGSGVTDE